jgi:hypothetical protein
VDPQTLKAKGPSRIQGGFVRLEMPTHGRDVIRVKKIILGLVDLLF